MWLIVSRSLEVSASQNSLNLPALNIEQSIAGRVGQHLHLHQEVQQEPDHGPVRRAASGTWASYLLYSLANRYTSRTEESMPPMPISDLGLQLGGDQPEDELQDSHQTVADRE